MKKIISLLLTFVMALSLCSISAVAEGEITLPMNGTRYTATVTPGTTTYTFTLPQTAGVTDLTVEVYSLPETYTIQLRGNGITPVSYPGSSLETIFTETSLKPGRYYLDITGTDTSELGEYSIILGTLTHASNNPNDPTQLTVGEYFNSNIYRGREIDYYTFTIDEPSDVTIVAGYTPPTRKYTMVLSGNNIRPVTVPTIGDQMTLTDEPLDPGRYFIKIDSTVSARMEPFETWYRIKVTATPNTEVEASGPINTLFTKYGGKMYYPGENESSSLLHDTDTFFVDYPNTGYKNSIYLFIFHQSNTQYPLDYSIHLHKKDGTMQTIECNPRFDINGIFGQEVSVTEDVDDMYVTIDSWSSDQHNTYYWVSLEDYMEY